MPSIIARQILQELEVESIKVRLKTLPEQLKAARIEESAARQRVAETKEKVDTEEAGLLLEITNAMDDKTGKLKYSNAETRSAALTILKTKHPYYQAALKVYQEAHSSLEHATTTIRELDENFGVAKTLARLVTAEIMLLADVDLDHS